MNAKNILITIIILLVLGGGVYWYMNSRSSAENGRMVSTTTDIVSTTTDPNISSGKLKVANFSGKLEIVDVGCFVDGECYVVVDGKHVTVIMGWSRETVGSVLGVEDFGALSNHIGEEVEVYAQDKGDGTYTLYGSTGFYVKLK